MIIDEQAKYTFNMISIVENNPFRILGVYSDTPLKNVIANANKIKAFVKIGKSVPMETDKINGFTSLPTRTAETVDDALALLQSEADKAKYSLFWFNNSGINFGTEKLIKDDVEGAAAQFMSAIESNDISILQNVIGDKTNSLTTADLLKCYVEVMKEYGFSEQAILGLRKTLKSNTHKSLLSSLQKGTVATTLKEYSESVSCFPINVLTTSYDPSKEVIDDANIIYMLFEPLKIIIDDVKKLVEGKNISEDITIAGAYDQFCKTVRSKVIIISNTAFENIGKMAKWKYTSILNSCIDLLNSLDTKQASVGTATKISEVIDTLNNNLKDIDETFLLAIASNEDICWYCGEKAKHKVEKKYQRKEERHISYNTKEVTTYTRIVKLHVCDKCQHENDMTENAENAGCFLMLAIECLIAIFITCNSGNHFRWNWDWALPIVLGNLFFGYIITAFVGKLIGKGIRGLWHIFTGRKSRKFIRKDNDHPLIKQIKKDGFRDDSPWGV